MFLADPHNFDIKSGETSSANISNLIISIGPAKFNYMLVGSVWDSRSN